MAELQLEQIENQREMNPTALSRNVIEIQTILNGTEPRMRPCPHPIGSEPSPSRVCAKTQCKALEESACEEHMREVNTITGRNSGITFTSSGVRRHVQRILT